jgi:hypothetical protein
MILNHLKTSVKNSDIYALGNIPDKNEIVGQITVCGIEKEINDLI